MDIPKSTHRSDEQLLAMLGEPCQWLVNGPDGLIIGDVVANLREALRSAAAFAEGGQKVVALSGLNPGPVIVFSDQMQRLRNIIVASRTFP